MNMAETYIATDIPKLAPTFRLQSEEAQNC